MENEEKITLSREELRDLLEEAAKRGAAAAVSGTDAAENGDPEDAEVLEFISTFGPERNTVGARVGRWLSHCESAKDSLRKKLDEYNAFEARIEPYYAYADDPEDVEDDLPVAELERRIRKHDIYLRLRDEKIRRFGLLGLHRGRMGTSLLDEVSFTTSADAMNA